MKEPTAAVAVARWCVGCCNLSYCCYSQRFILPLLPRGQILFSLLSILGVFKNALHFEPKSIQKLSLALRQPFALAQLTRKANTGCVPIETSG